jgi:hypothetical protein
MSKIINVIKESFVWQVDLVEDHPWLCLALIWALGILALAF